jgi:hypothetical protein
MTQPRKGEKYRPEIASLVRDALTTRREIEGESDPRERQRIERKRDIAIDEIVTMYRDYEKQGQLDKLPLEIQIVCEHLRCLNGGKLPTRKGGRPPDEHKKLLIAVKVAEALAAQPGRKSVTDAVRHVHKTFVLNGKRCAVPENTIRDYYYDRAPGWQRAIKVELAWRQLQKTRAVA